MTRVHRPLISAPSRLSRRSALHGLALGGLALCAPGGASAQRPGPKAGSEGAAIEPALAGRHHALPMPFKPGSLRGLSERMITSHHQNNYGGAVRNLNAVELELSRIGPATPPYVVAALRERELTFRNSKLLHEAYFGNLGGDGKRGGAVERALALAYGGAASRWEEHLRATAMGLSGGSGWVILALELDTGALRTTSSGGHAQALAGAAPLLVLDMYEHSYQMDYGAQVARYLDAFLANLNWDEVNRRLARAERAADTWRGKA